MVAMSPAGQFNSVYCNYMLLIDIWQSISLSRMIINFILRLLKIFQFLMLLFFTKKKLSFLVYTNVFDVFSPVLDKVSIQLVGNCLPIFILAGLALVLFFLFGTNKDFPA